jgi:hypothetical protein
LFWLSSYVTSCHLAEAPQFGANDHFYCTVYSITRRVSNNLILKNVESGVGAKINAWII